MWTAGRYFKYQNSLAVVQHATGTPGETSRGAHQWQTALTVLRFILLKAKNERN